MAADDFVLKAVIRDELGKGPAHRLRNQGRVPVVVYGHGNEGVNLSMEYGDIAALMHHVGLLSIQVEKNKPITAIIKDYQLDVLKGHLIHVDFQEVRADEVITATIPVHLHGTPVGEAHGGIIDQALHEIEIRCPANQMLELIEVDISKLDIEKPILAGDIDLPQDIGLETDPEAIVFSMYIPLAQEEVAGVEAEVEGEEGSEPEVISKGKHEDGKEEEA